MDALRLRLAQLVLENMPFPRYQARTVLDIDAADGSTTQFLQYYLPYSTVFGLRTAESAADLAACGQRYLESLPNSFRCDCVVVIADGRRPIQELLSQAEAISARWALVVASWREVHSIDWKVQGYRVHYEITEEPDDGVVVIAARDRETQMSDSPTSRVLIASPVRQKPAVLEHFLQGLLRLDTSGLEVEYFFIDNNDDASASQMLCAFAQRANAPVHRLRLPVAEAYHRTEAYHQWTESLIWRLAAMKDGVLNAAREHGFDYAFLVDSDLVLHPQTLQRMVACRRDIVSQVFWTVWTPDKPPLPNVWYADFYNLYRARRRQELNTDEQRRRTEAFLSALAFYPGLYRVSGLGACTLISRRAIESGVGFSELRGCTLAGEDRHFCLRAESLGFPLLADSTLPPLHLYRESELPRVDSYWRMVEAGLTGESLNRAMFELLLQRAA